MPQNPNFPLHRLNTSLTGAWFCGGDVKRFLANKLLKLYRGGYGVCINTMRLVAVVNPRGEVRDLKPPFVMYHMGQAANQPGKTVCPCANFYYPESAGPWRETGFTGHHPLCQWDLTSGRVYSTLLDKAPKDQHGIAHVAPGERPDEWQRERKRQQDDLGIK